MTGRLLPGGPTPYPTDHRGGGRQCVRPSGTDPRRRALWRPGCARGGQPARGRTPSRRTPPILSTCHRGNRRKALFAAATTSFAFIADPFLTTLTNAARNAEVRKGKQGGWAIRINDAQMILSGPRETAAEIWHIGSTPAPFDIIASASLSLKVPANHHGYNGRSHSLWYADAQTEAETVSSFSAAAPA